MLLVVIRIEYSAVFFLPGGGRLFHAGSVSIFQLPHILALIANVFQIILGAFDGRELTGHALETAIVFGLLDDDVLFKGLLIPLGHEPDAPPYDHATAYDDDEKIADFLQPCAPAPAALKFFSSKLRICYCSSPASME